MYKLEVDHISSLDTAQVIAQAYYVRVYVTQSSDSGA